MFGPLVLALAGAGRLRPVMAGTTYDEDEEEVQSTKAGRGWGEMTIVSLDT